MAEEIKSQDAIYVLAYSIIMLNTDLHNPQIRVCAVALTFVHAAYALFQKRMTIEEALRHPYVSAYVCIITIQSVL